MPSIQFRAMGEALATARNTIDLTDTCVVATRDTLAVAFSEWFEAAGAEIKDPERYAEYMFNKLKAGTES